MHNISVYFENDGVPLQLKRVAAGQTLLEVFLANNINIRHDCGGVCYCTTCHLYVEKGAAFIEKAHKREIDFLKKVAGQKANSRLACQCLLIEGKGEVDLVLPMAKQ